MTHAQKSQSPQGLTPAMAQWFVLKKEHPHALLFFRMGDFYELFFEDATVASSALDIVLTGRGKYEGNTIPMCGVPAATAPAYLARLVRRGFRVAVAEQTQSPGDKKGGVKGPLTRQVVRLVTPGTLTEDELLEPSRSNYLLAITTKRPKKKKSSSSSSTYGAAWIDISTGYFATQNIAAAELMSLIVKLDPAEILSDGELSLEHYQRRLTSFPVSDLDDSVVRDLAGIFQVSDLSAYGTFTPQELRAALMVARYVQHTQAGVLPHLLPPTSLNGREYLQMDPSTRLSLDIISTHEGQSHNTLYSCVNYTVSASGGRMLRDWLSSPLMSTSEISRRQQAWISLRDNADLMQKLRDFLKRNPDIMRALGRITFRRDLKRSFATVAAGLDIAHKIYALFKACEHMSPVLMEAIAKLNVATDLTQTLQAALVDDPEEKEAVIKSSYDSELAKYRVLKDNSRKMAASLEQKYMAKFEVSNLRIRHHAQMGYVFEVPAAHESTLRTQHPELFFRKGTKNAARFATQELVDLNMSIAKAQENAALREGEIIEQLAQTITYQADLPPMARALALLDVLQSCGKLASFDGWTCPVLKEDQSFSLKGARHPVVEAALPPDEDFVPNDCDLSDKNRIMLLTGPNMAGKSTYLRQVALIVILAQAALPVSADHAVIGIVDQLFSRVGAADDLVRGQSTFMVEMTETAAILNQAGPRSLVVVDEIGRGTATFDGLAIAQAVLETLHGAIRCRGIFATHFHELAQISKKLDHICLYTMAVREWEGKIIFLHEIAPGEATRSWGVHVAQLAGVPKNVVHRAREIVTALEAREESAKAAQLSLFGGQYSREQIPQAGEPDPIVDELKAVQVDDVTPRKALDILYELVQKARKV